VKVTKLTKRLMLIAEDSMDECLLYRLGIALDDVLLLKIDTNSDMGEMLVSFASVSNYLPPKTTFINGVSCVE